jgi:serralysin
VATPTKNFVPATMINPLSAGAGRYEIAGYKWGGGLGTSVTLTYSFPGLNASHISPYGYYTSNDEWQGFSPLSAADQAGARAALAAWSSVANVHFVEVADTATSAGEIRFGKSSTLSSGEAAHAYYPANDPSAGDVWLNSANWNQSNASSILPGSYDFATLVHELGHSLGLKHTFEAPNAIPTSYDNYFYSVMSYSARTSGDSGWSSFNPTTPMYYDLVAIQALYGRNVSHNSGDTVYTFVEGKTYFQTIDDAGGTDTIVYQGTTGSTIDLTPGHFSSVSAPIYFDTGSTRATVAIGPNTLIENATGGSGADTLLGNSLANTLTGGDGNDKLYGYGGNDRLFGGAGNDYLVGGAGQDAFYFNTALSATTNKDTIADFNPVDDKIYLAHLIFTHLAMGILNAANFWIGAAAHDSNDYIVYDKTHGTLAYDSNGNAFGGSVVFATVTANTGLTTADIIIY